MGKGNVSGKAGQLTQITAIVDLKRLSGPGFRTRNLFHGHRTASLGDVVVALLSANYSETQTDRIVPAFLRIILSSRMSSNYAKKTNNKLH